MTTATIAPHERARPEWLRRHPRAWVAAVGTVCAGAFMGQLDASIVALTYRPIGAEFGAGLPTVQWITLSYLIALGGLLIPLGRLADRLGRKRMYLWGFAGFTVASAGCALAPGLPALVGARAVQGVGAAMLQANSVAIVATAAPRSRLRLALGVQAAAQALGLALGPTIGGLLVQVLGWRWVFAVNVPVGVLALLAGRYLIPRTRLVAERHAAARTVRPLLRGLAGALLAYLLLFGPIVLVPAVAPSSALVAGLTAAALPLGFAAGATLGGMLLPAGWAPARRSLAGLLLAGLGLAALAGTLPHLSLVAVALAVAGLGLGIFTPANNAQVMTAAPAGAAALAGGLISTARAAGTALGTVAVTSLLGVDGGGRVAAAVLAGAVVLAAATVGAPRAPGSGRVSGA
jgi:predicted MFS family arabinose efflux permease